MTCLVLSSGQLRASIAPQLGAGIADLSLLGPSGYFYPLMRRAAPEEGNASLLGSFIMAPWANRIRAGTFPFAGKQQSIRTNTNDGMAQHGDVRKRPWTVLEQSAQSATLEYTSAAVSDSNWPWRYRCRASYGLQPDRFTISLSVRNDDSTPFPAGCGHHPYFSRRLWDDGDILEVRAPVTGRYPLDAGCATGAAQPERLCARLATSQPFPDEHIDAVFAGFGGVAELRWPSSGITLTMRASPNMNHLVLFAPHANGKSGTPLPFVAVEPQTQVNDAFNLETRGVATTGVVVLAPGQSLETTCAFEISNAT
ncbi:MAG: hypothetical protein JSS51_14375 [Planctomycetes bacterium]|nr:hypothetical protein [Planctomycetota bacterium]